MDFKDYYATLGVSKTASEKEIKQAYRKLARKYHPDLNPNDKTAEAKFKEINEANEVLGDPAKRRKYEELGANWRAYEQAGRAPGGQPGPSAPFGGQARPMTEDEMRDMFGDSDPFSDFFHTFFGGATAGRAAEAGRRARAGGRPRARDGRDVEHEIELTLEDALQGATRRLSLKYDGHAHTVDVRIPAGVGDGSRVRVPGEGEQGTGGASSGDLYLRIHLLPHAQFEARGKDLHTRVTIPLTTAVLGGEAEVRTLAGKTLRLKIPSGTQFGQLFRLKGHGMPTTGKPDSTGDLYASADIQLPRDVTPEQRELFEALRKLDPSTKHSAA